MKTNFPLYDSSPVASAQATPVDLDTPNAVQTVCAQAKAVGAQPHRASVLVDCQHLKCQRTLGVSHVVSQLLLLRRAGAEVWLRRVNAPLQRCLRLLQLTSLFHFVEAEQG